MPPNTEKIMKKIGVGVIKKESKKEKDMGAAKKIKKKHFA